jgi:ribose transport system substrate-binding protein
VARTGINKGTAFRILATLQFCGLVEAVGERGYRLRIRSLKPKKFRLGYAAESNEFPFTREVTAGIERVAAEEQLDLLVLDNRYSAKTAVRNAEILVKERVDLVIEFQADAQIAAIISERFLEAGIPLIAIDIPHPGAVYYGANNYGAGLMAGRFAGRWAKAHWNGLVDEVLLMELPRAGTLPRTRLTGMLAGIKEMLPEFDEARAVFCDANGQFGRSLEAVRKHLRRSRARHVIVGAINEPSIIGALRALEEAGRASDCVAVGQNGSAEARAELLRPGTRLLATVGFFPEKYGNGLIPLALSLLQNRPAPPAVFVKHKLITAENVGHLYPNDVLLTAEAIDTLLMRFN